MKKYAAMLCTNMCRSHLLLIALLIVATMILATTASNSLIAEERSSGISTSSKVLSYTEDPKFMIINGTFGTPIPFNVSGFKSCVVQYFYNFFNETSSRKAFRVHVNSSNANESFPVLFVVKQQLGILSWQIPLYADNSFTFGYYSVSRTLCPIEDYSRNSLVEPDQTIFIDVSTSSATSIAVSLRVTNENNFYMSLNNPVSVISTPSQPWYFEVNFDENVDNVLVKVTSPDTLCAVVSLQDARCPVFDLDRNVAFNGTYQTMTTISALAVKKSVFPDGFFVVLVVKTNDESCVGVKGTSPSRNQLRLKNLTVEVIPTISEKQYWIAAFVVLGLFLLFYLFAVIVAVVNCIRGKSNEDLIFIHAENLHYQRIIPQNISYGTITPSSSFNTSHAASQIDCSNDDEVCPETVASCSSLLHRSSSMREVASSDSSSLDDSDIDLLPDADSEKEIVRTKTFLYVSDLARKKCKTLKKKSQMYSWNVLTIAILYALPVVQLVLTYQRAVNATGNQDICYYNFLCAHPRGYFSDFNHVYSNIGYILLGFLFLCIVWRRDLLHKKLIEMDRDVEKFYGIPHHFGLFYAMAVALMMEGLLSACYHVCPNYTNFQFDASFMYMIAGLCMLKIYQTRHPDINADAYSASLAFAFVILMAVVGVLYGNIIYWILFTTLHILSCLALTAQIYYMGRWKLNLGIFKRIYLQVKNEFVSSDFFCRPMYMDRMILLGLGNIINWSLAIYGLVRRPQDFPSYVLSIFMVNLVLYLMFYIIMKLRSGEKFQFLSKLYILLTSVAWAASLYFFLGKKTISWELTPALSRQKNSPCEMLDFYDSHDIWHFLSATSLFFSFMVLLTMDDDLILTPRDKIHVF